MIIYYLLGLHCTTPPSFDAFRGPGRFINDQGREKKKRLISGHQLPFASSVSFLLLVLGLSSTTRRKETDRFFVYQFQQSLFFLKPAAYQLPSLIYSTSLLYLERILLGLGTVVEFQVDVIEKDFPNQQNDIPNIFTIQKPYKKKGKKTKKKDIHGIPSRPNGLVIPASQRPLHSTFRLYLFSSTWSP